MKIQDANSKLKGICHTLVGGTPEMAAAVVGQESGKQIYSTNSTAPDFEEGLVPGTFIGGVVGTAPATQLARSLWELGMPGFKEPLEGIDDLGLAGVERIMGQSLVRILDAGLDDLGVNAERAARFSAQSSRLYDLYISKVLQTELSI